jgi:S-adenosylmethionine synthetase
VTGQYDDGAPVRVQAVVVRRSMTRRWICASWTDDIAAQVIRAVIPAVMLDADTNLYQSDRTFCAGRTAADTGLTGRKIIADTYGGYARHGGGAFSGKDATRSTVRRLIMARFIAKNIVASGAARSCELH